MTPRRPTKTLVVDANIVLSALRGRKTLAHLDRVRKIRALATSATAREEVYRVLSRLGGGAGEVELADGIFAMFEIADEQDAPRHAAAAAFLARAPASRTGSTADAHILALAWTLDADIWSHDRDFAGTGWPSWSSANLIDALADEAG